MSLGQRETLMAAGTFRAVGDALTELIIERAVAAFARISSEEAAQTYAVSFWVNDEEDDPRVPVLTIGTNTEAQFRASVANADDDAEARWNFAFWLQNELAVVGGPADHAGRAIVDALFATLGLHLAEDDFSPASEAVSDRMTTAFVSCCVDAARRLHEEGALHASFGRDLPVLVHELEYYDAIIEQNSRCNPPHLIAGFKRWIESM